MVEWGSGGGAVGGRPGSVRKGVAILTAEKGKRTKLGGHVCFGLWVLVRNGFLPLKGEISFCSVITKVFAKLLGGLISRLAQDVSQVGLRGDF